MLDEAILAWGCFPFLRSPHATLFPTEGARVPPQCRCPGSTWRTCGFANSRTKLHNGLQCKVCWASHSQLTVNANSRTKLQKGLRARFVWASHSQLTKSSGHTEEALLLCVVVGSFFGGREKSSGHTEEHYCCVWWWGSISVAVKNLQVIRKRHYCCVWWWGSISRAMKSFQVIRKSIIVVCGGGVQFRWP